MILQCKITHLNRKTQTQNLQNYMILFENVQARDMKMIRFIVGLQGVECVLFQCQSVGERGAQTIEFIV